MRIRIYVIGMVLFYLCIGCKSEYQQAIEEGLASGEIHEDLVLDMKVGWTKKEFYAHCWQLNKEEKIHQGSGNKYARSYLKPGEIYEEPEEIDMLFYGIFNEEDIMVGMDIRMSYVKWAPWNDELQSDKLVERMKKHYLNKYKGNEFIAVNIEDGDVVANVKVDGNRHILIYPLTHKDIAIKIEDLRYKKFL